MQMKISKVHWVSISLVAIAAVVAVILIAEMRADFSGATPLIQRESFERLVKEKQDR